MRMKRLYKLALGVVFLACTLPAGLSAQTSGADTDKKIADLEKQLEAIRAELDALKTAAGHAGNGNTGSDNARGDPPAAAAVATAAPAAPADPLAGITSVLGGVNLTGLVDGYYAYNANTLPPARLHEPFTFRIDRFALNLIELQLDKPVDKTTPLGFRVAIGFGDAMNAINNAASGRWRQHATQYLKEGYLSYMAPLGKGLQFDFGKFVTPAGAEVIETNQNWNYSRSLLFYDAIPYYHFGARAKYTFNDKWSVTGYMTNGWNNIASSNSGKTGGVSACMDSNEEDHADGNVSGRSGRPGFAGNNGNWNNLTDTVLAYNPTTKLSLMANFDYDRQEVFVATKQGRGLHRHSRVREICGESEREHCGTF